jgi:hypothetical protein
MSLPKCRMSLLSNAAPRGLAVGVLHADTRCAAACYQQATLLTIAAASQPLSMAPSQLALP